MGGRRLSTWRTCLPPRGCKWWGFDRSRTLPRRNRIRPGDHLVTDDRTGIVHYASEMVQEWTGLLVRRGTEDYRHPQEFVRSLPDPQAPTNVRSEPGPPFDDVCGYYVMEWVPGIGIKRTPTAYELNNLPLPGIGVMTIGSGTSCGLDFWIVD